MRHGPYDNRHGFILHEMCHSLLQEFLLNKGLVPRRLGILRLERNSPFEKT